MGEQDEEIFEVVDESGKVIDKEKRGIVHRAGLLHKGIHAFVLDKQGRIFIQQRAFNRFIAPGKWDMSVAEHLKPGESFEEAAARGIEEELSVKPVALKKIGERDHHLKEGEVHDNEKVEIFKCGFEGEIKLLKEEVVQGKWISKQDLLNEMDGNPERFTPWFLENRKFFSLL